MKAELGFVQRIVEAASGFPPVAWLIARLRLPSLDIIFTQLEIITGKLLTLLKVAFLLSVILGVFLLISVSLYTLFYYTVIGEHLVELPLHLIFDSSCKLGDPDHKFMSATCSFLHANISFRAFDRNGLSFGQPYRVAVQLTLPDNHINRSIGMFIIKLQVYARGFSVIQEVTKSALVPYRSAFLRFIDLCLYWPLYVLNWKEETVSMEKVMFNVFVDDPYKPSTGVLVEIQSPHIQIYDGILSFHAQYSGLKYLMFRFPSVSALVGTGTIFLILLLIFVIVLARRWMLSAVEEAPDWLDELDNDQARDWPEPRPIPRAGSRSSLTRQEQCAGDQDADSVNTLRKRLYST